MVIDENQLSSEHNILNSTKFEENKQRTSPPHMIRPNQLWLKASFYLSIGHSKVNSSQIAGTI